MNQEMIEDAIYKAIGLAANEQGIINQALATSNVMKILQERMYSEEEVKKISVDFFYHWWNAKGNNTEEGFNEWFEQFKKKSKMAQPSSELTYGQKLVGLTFNPSNDDKVAMCKQKYAELIDEMNNLREKTSSQEVKRMCSIAITELQTAQMGV
jgi:hypothetical protein